MAKQDEKFLQAHNKTLVEAAAAFAQSNKLRSYKDPTTGEIILPHDPSFHKQLQDLLPEFKHQDPYVMFKNIKENLNAERIKLILNPLPQEEVGEEPKQEQEKSEEKEEKEKPVKISSSSESKTPKEEANQAGEDKTKATETPQQENAPIKQDLSPEGEESITQTQKQPEGQNVPPPPLEADVTQTAPLSTPESISTSSQETPVIEIKPLPTTFPVPKPTSNEQSNTTPRPINPTPPPASRQEPPKTAAIPTPAIEKQTNTTSVQTPTSTTSNTVKAKTPIFQTIKNFFTAFLASETVKTVAKESSFQAQMATKKGIDKAVQVTGSFAKGGLETVGNLFQPKGPTFDESIDYIDYDVSENDQYYQPNQQYSTTRIPAIPYTPNLRGVGTSSARTGFFRSFAGRAVMASGIAFLFYFVFFSGILESTAPLMNFGQTTIGEASPLDSGAMGNFCPTPEAISQNRDPLTCRYLNPAVGLFDTNISQEGINNYIEKYSPVFIKSGKGDRGEFTRRVNYIVQQSQQAGLNPAIFLGFWKSESAFSTYPGASDMGCAPGAESMQGFERQVQCALGLISGGSQTAQCAVSKDASSRACVGEQGRITRYPDVYTPAPKIPIATFDDFMEMYGPRSQALLKYQPTADGVNRNCSHTYNTVLEIVTLVNSCRVPSQTVAGPILPLGEKGERIASVGMQVTSQLLHSINDRAQIQALGMNCAPGSPNGGANSQYTGYHCWAEMILPKYDIVPDPDYLQCTEFIIAVFDKAGFYDQIKLISAPGNARDWANNARKYPDKFAVFNDPRALQPGDIISLGAAGNAGHLALVVKKEANRIQVAQAATDQKLEDWFIDMQTGRLNPGYNYASRQLTPDGGFIRLLDYTEKFQ